MPLNVALFAPVAAGAGKTVSTFTVLSAVGTAVQALGAIQKGQAAQSQANLQASILQQQAERERQEAEAREEDFRRRQSLNLAFRRAALGASGVVQGEGSPLLVGEDFAAEVEFQALRIRSGGELRATRAEQQAALQRFQGRAASRAGFVRGGSLLITGAGKSFGGGSNLRQRVTEALR